MSARLHERYPVRFWDHDLGPGRPQIRVHDPLAADRLAPAVVVHDPDERGQRLREHAISPDGTTLAVAVDVRDEGDPAAVRVRLELRGPGGTEVVADEPGVDHERPTITPDGRWLLWIRERHARPGAAPAHTLMARPVAGGDVVTVLPEGRLTVTSVTGAADPDLVLVTADEQGHGPVFRVGITTGEVLRLTRSGAYTDVVPSPEGGALYALRSAPDSPADPGAPRPLRARPGAGGAARADRDRRPPGLAHRGHRDRGGRDAAAGVAGAARRVGRPGPAAAVGARRPVRELERLDLAVEPVGGDGARLRGPAARPRACRPATARSSWTSRPAPGAGCPTPTS